MIMDKALEKTGYKNKISVHSPKTYLWKKKWWLNICNLSKQTFSYNGSAILIIIKMYSLCDYIISRYDYYYYQKFRFSSLICYKL